jgi:hypothetical protein
VFSICFDYTTSVVSEARTAVIARHPSCDTIEEPVKMLDLSQTTKGENVSKALTQISELILREVTLCHLSRRCVNYVCTKCRIGRIILNFCAHIWAPPTHPTSAVSVSKGKLGNIAASDGKSYKKLQKKFLEQESVDYSRCLFVKLTDSILE